MQLQQPFDARQVEPASFAPPPVFGDYHVRVVESEAKPTKDRTGGFVEFVLEILDPGPYQARKIPYRLNMYNANPQTVEISYRQLSALCYVVGVFQVQDTRQLHGIPFIATIGPQTNDPQYANVFAVKDINGNIPGKAAGPGQPAIAAPPAAAAPPAVAPPAWGAPAPAATPPAAAPPVWGQPAPAWGQPPAAPAPAAPPWGTPPAAAPAPAAAPWAPPGAPQAAAAPPAAAPPWAPAGAAPAPPPWAAK